MPKFDPRFWEIQVDPEVLDRLGAEVPADAWDPGPQAARELPKEAVAQLRELIRTRLTERQRDVVTLYYYDGLSQEEIASTLGITQQVVSKHLFGVIRNGKKIGGALQKLRKAFERSGVDPTKWM